ncbi:MAG: hypothetical protein ACE5GC_01615 [Acidimicrobiia bacterium]
MWAATALAGVTVAGAIALGDRTDTAPPNSQSALLESLVTGSTRPATDVAIDDPPGSGEATDDGAAGASPGFAPVTFNRVLRSVTCDGMYEEVPGLSEGGSSGNWSWGPTIRAPLALRYSKCTYQNPDERAVNIDGNGIAREAVMLIGFDFLNTEHGATVEESRDEFLALHEMWVKSCADWTPDLGNCSRELEVVVDDGRRFVAQSRFQQDRLDMITDDREEDQADTHAFIIEEVGPAIVRVEWRIGGRCPVAFRDDTGDMVPNPVECTIPAARVPSSVPWAESLMDAIRDAIHDL